MIEKTWKDIGISDIEPFLQFCSSNENWRNLWRQLDKLTRAPDCGGVASYPDAYPGPRSILAYLFTACLFFSSSSHENFSSFLSSHDSALTALSYPDDPENWREVFYSLLGSIGIEIPLLPGMMPCDDKTNAESCYHDLVEAFDLFTFGPQADTNFTLGTIWVLLRELNDNLSKANKQWSTVLGSIELEKILDNGQFFQIWKTWKESAPPPENVNNPDFFFNPDDYQEALLSLTPFIDGPVIYDDSEFEDEDEEIVTVSEPGSWKDIPVKDISPMLENAAYSACWRRFWSELRLEAPSPKLKLLGSRIVMNYLLTACMMISDRLLYPESPLGNVMDFSDRHMSTLAQLRNFDHRTRWRVSYFDLLSRIVTDPEPPVPNMHKTKASICYTQLADFIAEEFSACEDLASGSMQLGALLDKLLEANKNYQNDNLQLSLNGGKRQLCRALDSGCFYEMWRSWKNHLSPSEQTKAERERLTDYLRSTCSKNAEWFFSTHKDDYMYPDDVILDSDGYVFAHGRIYEFDHVTKLYLPSERSYKDDIEVDVNDESAFKFYMPDISGRAIPVKDIAPMLESCTYTARWLKLWPELRWVPKGQRGSIPGPRIILNYVLTACMVLSDLASPTESHPADVVEFANKHIDALMQFRTVPYTHWTQWRACYLSYLSRIVPDPEGCVPHRHKVKANECYSQIVDFIEREQLTLENLTLGTLMDKLMEANVEYQKENRQLDFSWGKNELDKILDNNGLYWIWFSWRSPLSASEKDECLLEYLKSVGAITSDNEYCPELYMYPKDVIEDSDYIYAHGDIYVYDRDYQLYIHAPDRYYGDEVEVDDDDESVFVDEKPNYIGKDGNEYVYNVDTDEYTFFWEPSHLLSKLERFHLGERTLQELKQLIELLRHRHDGELADMVRYGLLLQCDSDDYGKEFLTAFSQLLEKAKLLNAPPTFVREGDEHGGPNTLENKSLLRVVCGCKQAPVVDRQVSSSREEQTIKQLEAWEAFWKAEEQLLRQKPNTIGVAIVSRDVMSSCWKQRDHLFYRVYGHHSFLDEPPTEDVYTMVCQHLTKIGMDMSDDFLKALREYVDTVYPTADLRYKDFVDDLINRLLTKYYSVSKLEKALTPRCVPYYRRPLGFEEIISKMDQIVGLDSVKESFKELYYESRHLTNNKTPMRLHMAFVGNTGTGKTTVAQMAADLLYSMGLIKKNKLVSVKAADLISYYVGMTPTLTRDKCREAYGGVLFIDEAYTLTYSQNQLETSNSAKHSAECVTTLLQEMEDNADQLTVIFAGYPEHIERFLASNEGLRSRVTRTIHFPDFTDDELLKIFEQICEREHFTVAEDGYQALKACIAFEKSGKDFGNARAVETIYRRIRAQWSEDPNPNKEQIFTKEHIRAILPEQHNSDIGSMIGLDDIKEQLQKFEQRVKYLHLLSEKGGHTPPKSMHMLFMGNPGTGKTTVAQIIAEDLYKIGILNTNKCISVEARDLIANRYDAAKKTEEIILSAKGGVLFLDEAYALTEYASGNVGREVVATLITAMEKYRGEMVMIFAGYPSNMRAFLNVNPGLTSRIGHTFYFKDYSVVDLVKMFLTKMQKYGFVIADGVKEKVSELMEYFHVVPDFGNGRFVDNVIDETITCRAMRDESDPYLYNEITADDIPTIAMLKESMPNGEWFRDPAEVTQEEKRRTAVHEMGHALLSVLLRPELELTSISISAQADSYGRVSFPVPKGNLTEEQMLAQISILLGGRAAEIVVFGTHSTGCAGDYETAKHCASNMLEYYAMGSDQLGDNDIRPLLNGANEAAMELLEEYKADLIALSEMLLEQQELTDERLRQYFAEHSMD